MLPNHTPNLLDALDELLQLPYDQRKQRLLQLKLGEEDRAKLASWLESHNNSDGFLEEPLPLVRQAMKLLMGTEGPVSQSPPSVPPKLSDPSVGLSAAALEACLAPSIPGYQIQGFLGQGGMASVWRAVQIATGREVALKVLNPMLFSSRRARMRFDRELQLTARLSHPHIARIYDGGVYQAACYFAMELIDGQPLDLFVKSKGLTRRQILQLVLRVCQAVKYAHQKGVIHRDLKPSNILIDDDAFPHVLDFGLAKALAEEGTELSISRDGALAGTPEYMSPEQAAGGTAIDTRTDVYSLGVILYRLLTGKHPHGLSDSKMIQALQRISTQEVVPPRVVCPSMDAELEALLLKALDRNPEQRYGGAGELERDIQRYLNDEPMEAAPPSPRERLRKFVRKHRLALGIATCFALVLLAATIVSTWQMLRATRAAARESAQRRQADTVARLLESIFKAIDPTARQTGGADLSTRLSSKLTQMRANLDMNGTTELAVRARLRNALGEAELGLGETAVAEQLFRSALDDQRQAPPNDTVTLAILGNLARVCLDNGRIAEARRLLEQVRDQQVRTLGFDHPDTLNTLSMLASTYPPIEAARQLEWVRERQARQLGADHPDTLMTLHNLAEAYNMTGAREKAIELFEQARDAQVRRLGPDDPDTLATLNDLARVYGSTGRHDEAIKTTEQVRDRLINKLGPTHPLTLYTQNRLALLYEYANRSDDAIRLFEQVRGLELQTLGPYHPETLSALCSLGWTYMQRDQYAKAAALYQEVTDWRIAHPDQLPESESLRESNLLAALINCYRGMRDISKAEFWVQRARATLEKSLGPGIDEKSRALDLHPENPQLWADRGRLYARLGQFEKAAADFRRAVDAAPQNFLYWYVGLVPLTLQIGDRDTFQQLRTRELTQFKESQDREALAVSVNALMQPLEGEDLRLAMKLADRAFAADPQGWQSYGIRGMSEYRCGNYSQAMSWFNRSKDAGDELSGMVTCDFFIAMCRHRIGDGAQARELLHDATREMNVLLPRAGERDLISVSSWLLCQAIRREAEELISSVASVEPPAH